MLRRCALALCALALSLPPPCQARDSAQEPPNAVLLVAKPTILDPNFSQTVVLVTQTREGETVGVILNRPTPLAASALLAPELPSGNYHDSMYFGGPVLRQVIVALFHSERPPPAPAFHVLKDVYLSMHPDNIRMLLESKQRRYRLYVGFSGWAPGQLEAELDGDGWYVLPAEDDLLFRQDTAGLWQELVLRASGPRAAIPPKRTARARSGEAVFLIAEPGLRDIDYRQAVVIAARAPEGGHVGVILNRPTRRSLGSLFPDHEPSKKVRDPVFYGGPYSSDALVALVRSAASPGGGSLPLLKNLYLAFRAATIDHVIETTPNDARYYVGYVGWRPGELQREVDHGLWSVLDADVDTVFREDTGGLWQELRRRSHRIRAGLRCQAAALDCALSKAILPPR